MKIILDNEWYIEDDGRGYTLTKFTGRTNTDKNGNVSELYEHQSYTPTIISCVEKYVRLSMVDNLEKVQLNKYLESFSKKYDEVIKAINSIGVTR